MKNDNNRFRHIFLEAIGICFALFGSFFLIGTLAPIINPGFVALRDGDMSLFSARRIVLFIVSCFLISTGYYLSRKSQITHSVSGGSVQEKSVKKDTGSGAEKQDAGHEQ